MSDLPMGWCLAQLSNVATWGSGGTPSRSNKELYGGGIPWFKTGELGPYRIFQSEETITPEALEASSAKLFPAGSVVLAMYGATIVRSLTLRLPPIDEQTEIVRRVELLFAYADRLEARLRAAHTATERLPPRCWPRPFAASWCRKTPTTSLQRNCSRACKPARPLPPPSAARPGPRRWRKIEGQIGLQPNEYER